MLDKNFQSIVRLSVLFFCFFFAGTAIAVLNEFKLTAGDIAGGDEFGTAVSMSGDTAIVGSPEDNDDGTESGSAYIFVRFGDSWTQQAKLTASDAAVWDNFGISVSISGDTAIVGAYGDEDGAGAAYIFVRSGTTWTEQAKLTSGDAATYDAFGRSVSISGGTAIVGAVGDNDSGERSGSAHIFVRSGTTWTRQAILHASSVRAFDSFSSSFVSISGDTAIIGAYQDSDSGDSSGAVYIYVRSGSSWFLQARLTASDAAEADYFGYSVSISGDTAIVGARLNDDHGRDSGSAYIYVRTGSSWAQQAKLTANDAAAWSSFGWSVSISGDTSIIGALGGNEGTASERAYIFTRSGTSWTEQRKLTASDAVVGDKFSISVAIAGDTAIVGAPENDENGENSGAAYLYSDVLSPPIPSMTISPDPIAFGTVTVGVASQITVEIGNTGEAVLTVTGITSGLGTTLGISETTFNVSPSSTHQITLTLTTSATGPISGTLTITSNDPNSPTTIAITATAQPAPKPQITVTPNPIAFGTVTVGVASQISVEIGNTGNADLNITGITAGLGATLGISETAFNVSPSSTHQITLTLTATTVGPIDGTLTIISNDPNSPTTIAITALMQLPPATIKIDPPLQGIGRGRLGTFNVFIEEATNLGGFEFKLRYKTNRLSIRDVQVGNFSRSTGRQVTPKAPTFTTEGEYTILFFGAVIYGVAPPPSGDGGLATITFTASGTGLTDLELFDVKIGDIDANALPVNATDGSVEVIPLVGIDPPTQNIEQGHSGTFNVLLQDAFNFGGFEFKLRYKTNRLSILDVQIGDFPIRTGRQVTPKAPTFMTDGEYTTLFYGAVTYGNAPPPNGDGVLATIAFTASTIGATDLDLFDVQIGDTDANAIPVDTADGAVEVFQIVNARLESATAQIPVGTTLTINLLIDNAFNASAFQFELLFDSRILSVVDVQYGPFLSSTGRTLHPVGPNVRESPSPTELAYAVVSSGTQPLPAGNGVLARMTFTAVGEGVGTLDLTEVKLLDADAVRHPVNVTGSSVEVVMLPPVAPTSLTATAVSSRRIDLSWQYSVGHVDGFRIERKEAEGSFTQIATVTGDLTSYSDTDVQPNTTYIYRVLAFNATGNSSGSDEASAKTLSEIENVTARIQVNQFGSLFNRRTGELSMMITLTNIGPDRLLELQMVIENITSPAVTVANAEGTTPAGKPYYNYGNLNPGETSVATRVVFNNPNRLRFEFDAIGWAKVDGGDGAAPPLKPLIGQPQHLHIVIPAVCALAQNYPNPFNPETWIPYELAEAGEVKIRIYDSQGHLVRTLDIGHQEVGQYFTQTEAAYWDGRSDTGEWVSSGVYFYHLQSGHFRATKKMLILK